MKALACVLAIVMIGVVGCGDRPQYQVTDLAQVIQKRSYTCLELGYHCANAGYSLEEATAKLEDIIGPKPPSPETAFSE